MRTPTLWLAAFFALTGVSELAAQDLPVRTQLPADSNFVPGQVIVKMRDDVSLSAARLTALGLDPTVQPTAGSAYIYRIPTTTIAALAPAVSMQRTREVIDSLRADPNVEWAQPDYRVYPIGTPMLLRDMTPNDPRYQDQWHYFNNGSGSGESPGGINLPRAWDASTGDNTVVVSVLDTGILPNHPDVVNSSNLVAGYDMVSDPSTGNDGDGRDSDPTDPGDGVSAGECGGGQPPVDIGSSWHGTHVGGTVGVGGTNNGVGVAGVNWNVSMQAVRVLGKCGGSTSDINDAIRWAAGLSVPGVPDNTTPARVINMSLGAAGLQCSNSPSTQAAIDDAVAQGVTVVVSAGNEATDAANSMPASCDGVITVAASDARGHLVSRYSNFGPLVEIMAPGGDVQRDDNNDGNPDGVLSMVHPTVSGGYAYYNGTSMASPHVAGVVALWLAQDPTLTPSSVLSELQARALPRSSTECPRPCGAGLLNADRSGPLPPPAVTVTVELNPDETYDVGDNAAVTATVMVGGSPAAGKTVSFTSDDASIASVSPSSAMTDGSGKATTTLTAVARGNTSVTATVDGVSATNPVRVPSLTTIVMLLVAAAMVLTAFLRNRLWTD